MDIMHKFELSKSLDYYWILLNSCVCLMFISIQLEIIKVYGICNENSWGVLTNQKPRDNNFFVSKADRYFSLHTVAK